MAATIIPFPIIEGAFCVVPYSHASRKEPVNDCLCEHCIDRRRELALAQQVEKELRRARDNREAEERRSSILEKDAG